MYRKAVLVGPVPIWALDCLREGAMEMVKEPIAEQEGASLHPARAVFFRAVTGYFCDQVNIGWGIDKGYAIYSRMLLIGR